MLNSEEMKGNPCISKWSVFYPVVAFLLAVLSAIAVSLDYSIVTDKSVLEITNPIVRFTESFTYSLKIIFFPESFCFLLYFGCCCP